MSSLTLKDKRQLQGHFNFFKVGLHILQNSSVWLVTFKSQRQGKNCPINYLRIALDVCDFWRGSELCFATKVTYKDIDKNIISYSNEELYWFAVEWCELHQLQ